MYSFAWLKLLAAVSIFGIAVLLFWARCTSLKVSNYQTVDDHSFISNLNTNTSEEFFKVHQTLNSSIEHRNVASYCRINGCKVVSCSSISEDIDPATVASEFIESNFKVDCNDAKSVTLSFDNCKFPANTLRRNWLRTNVYIEGLTFNGCFLSEIEDNAFSSSIFESTKKITMVNNKVVSLRKAMFRHLARLEALTIQENKIKLAEFDLLEYVSSSLTILELSYSVIDNREVLRNVTGGNPLSKLEILSIRGNSIPIIDAELFTGVPAVRSLYLDNSNIKAVSSDTLKPMSSSIQQLILNNNDIPSLPAHLLDSILSSKRPFSMAIENNPWHCDCNLKWMQDLVRSHSNILTSIPICGTPEINSGKTFATADFCNQSATTTSAASTRDTSIESTTHNWNHVNESTTQTPITTTGTVNVRCSSVYTFLNAHDSRKPLSTDFLQFHSRFPDFYISGNLEEGILVNLPDLNGVTLLWFDNDDVEGSLGCAKNVKHSYLVRNIDPQSAYTICLLDDNEDTVSPLNCLAVTTRPAYESRTWLTNADKSLVISLSIFSLVLLFLFGGFLSFLLIRRHPTLLRGSKRVILAKRRNVDAIVLPKGVNVTEEKRGQRGNVASQGSKVQEDEYVTPLPPARIPLPRRSRISRMSWQSDRHSYVSGFEQAETLVDSWRTSRTRDGMEKLKSDAPPLPPHPCEAIPSLSQSVDTEDSNHYQISMV